MVIIDANILLYAYNEDSPEHKRAYAWLSDAPSRREVLGFSWLVILAFLRISTNPRLFSVPLSVAEAQTAVQGFLDAPNVEVINPTSDHWDILKKIIRDGQVRGPLMMDAHLAALCIERDATLATNDRDFMRFPGLKTINPLTTKS